MPADPLALSTADRRRELATLLARGLPPGTMANGGLLP